MTFLSVNVSGRSGLVPRLEKSFMNRLFTSSTLTKFLKYTQDIDQGDYIQTTTSRNARIGQLCLA